MNEEMYTLCIPIKQRLRIGYQPNAELSSIFYIETENIVQAAGIVQLISLQHVWLFENQFISNYNNNIIIERLNQETMAYENYSDTFFDWYDSSQCQELLNTKVCLNLEQNF